MYEPKLYMVNKGHKIRWDGRTYIYDYELPNSMIIDKTWVDQRVVILRKHVKEEIIKKKLKKKED